MKNELYTVAIGASAGGHSALKQLFSSLSSDLPAAYIVVTHLFRNHESKLHSILSRYTRMPVHKVSGTTIIQQGNVYVLPEDKTMTIKNSFLYLSQRDPNVIANRAIDIFFQSLAIDQKNRAIGIVLSGMGSDGSHGAVKIFQHGGHVLVQEPSSAEFDSMPWAAIMEDHPGYVVPPIAMGEKLLAIMRRRITIEPPNQEVNRL